MDGNSVTLEGNLTRDPETRFTKSGKSVTNCSVARSWKDGTGEQRAMFYDIVVWGEMGENLAASLHKGERVLLSGRLDQRKWEADDGTTRSKIEVTVDSIGPCLRWATAVAEKVVREAQGELVTVDEPF